MPHSKIKNLSYPLSQINQNLLNNNNRIFLNIEGIQLKNIKLLFEYKLNNRGQIYYVQDSLLDDNMQPFIVHDYDNIRYLISINFEQFDIIRSPDFNPKSGCYLELNNDYMYVLADSSIRITESDNRKDGLVYYYYVRDNISWLLFEYGGINDNEALFGDKVVSGINYVAVNAPKSNNGFVLLRNMNLPQDVDPFEFFNDPQNVIFFTVDDDNDFGSDITFIDDILYVSSKNNLYKIENNEIIKLNYWNNKREILNIYGDKELGLLYSYYSPDSNETFLVIYNNQYQIKISDNKLFFKFHSLKFNNENYIVFAIDEVLNIKVNNNISNKPIFTNNLIPESNNIKHIVNHNNNKNIIKLTHDNKNIKKINKIKKNNNIIKTNNNNNNNKINKLPLILPLIYFLFK